MNSDTELEGAYCVECATPEVLLWTCAECQWRNYEHKLRSKPWPENCGGYSTPGWHGGCGAPRPQLYIPPPPPEQPPAELDTLETESTEWCTPEPVTGRTAYQWREDEWIEEGLGKAAPARIDVVNSAVPVSGGGREETGDVAGRIAKRKLRNAPLRKGGVVAAGEGLERVEQSPAATAVDEEAGGSAASTVAGREAAAAVGATHCGETGEVARASEQCDGALTGRGRIEHRKLRNASVKMKGSPEARAPIASAGGRHHTTVKKRTGRSW